MSNTPDTEKLLCAICQEEVSEPTRFIPCRHAYHLGCVQRWLAVGPTCPLCRTTVEKIEDASGIVEYADAYLGRTEKQLSVVLEHSDSEPLESSFEASSESSEEYNSDESSSSVSRSRLDEESSSSYSADSDSDDQPRKAKQRKTRKDRSPTRRKR